MTGNQMLLSQRRQIVGATQPEPRSVKAQAQWRLCHLNRQLLQLDCPGSNEANGLRRLRKEPLEDPIHLLDEMRLKRVHRREFSFLAGDDFRNGHLKSLVSKPNPSPDRASTCLANRKEGESERDVSAKAGPRPQLVKAIVPLTEEDNTGKIPHREGSGKSVLTAIKESSSRRSSYSYQDSIGSNDGNASLTGTRKGLGDNNFAVAAARAARKRQAESEGRTNE